MDEPRGDEREAEILARLAECERRIMWLVAEIRRRDRHIAHLAQYLANLAGRGRG